MTAAFPRVRRIEGEGDKALFCQGLGIQPAGLLFHRAEGAAYGNRRQLALAAIFRDVEIADQGDTVAVLEGHLAVIDFRAFRKGFVPGFDQRNGRVRIGCIGIAHGCYST